MNDKIVANELKRIARTLKAEGGVRKTYAVGSAGYIYLRYKITTSRMQLTNGQIDGFMESVNNARAGDYDELTKIKGVHNVDLDKVTKKNSTILESDRNGLNVIALSDVSYEPNNLNDVLAGLDSLGYRKRG